jgi:hypothetical protein
MDYNREKYRTFFRLTVTDGSEFFGYPHCLIEFGKHAVT